MIFGSTFLRGCVSMLGEGRGGAGLNLFLTSHAGNLGPDLIVERAACGLWAIVCPPLSIRPILVWMDLLSHAIFAPSPRKANNRFVSEETHSQSQLSWAEMGKLKYLSELPTDLRSREAAAGTGSAVWLVCGELWYWTGYMIHHNLCFSVFSRHVLVTCFHPVYFLLLTLFEGFSKDKAD